MELVVLAETAIAIQAETVEQAQAYLAPCTQVVAVAVEITQQAQAAQLLEVAQVTTLQEDQVNLTEVVEAEALALTQMARAMADVAGQGV